jgi:hypothetical protein
MNGILENILAELQAIRALLAASGGDKTPGPIVGYAGNTGQQQQFSPPVQQQVPANVTSDQLMALIQPHVGVEAIKKDLGDAMRGMGINGLPEVQAHQIAPLYALFQSVIARHTGGGQQQQTQPASII